MSEPIELGTEVMINNKPIFNDRGEVLIKDGVNEVGVIVDTYTFNSQEYFVVDMGRNLELHFTREHFDVL